MTWTAALWILTREETNGAKEWGGQCGHRTAICSPPAYNPTVVSGLKSHGSRARAALQELLSEGLIKLNPKHRVPVISTR